MAYGYAPGPAARAKGADTLGPISAGLQHTLRMTAAAAAQAVEREARAMPTPVPATERRRRALERMADEIQTIRAAFEDTHDELARVRAAEREHLQAPEDRDRALELRWRVEHLRWQLDVLRDQFEQVRRVDSHDLPK